MHTMWRTKKMENQREIDKKNKRFQIKNAGLTKNFWDTGRINYIIIPGQRQKAKGNISRRLTDVYIKKEKDKSRAKNNIGKQPKKSEITKAIPGIFEL